MDIDELIQLAQELHQAGNLEQAERFYREILSFQPCNVSINNDLGNVLQDKGQLDEAILYHQKAIELKPDYAEAYYNLGDALQGKGQLDEAIACYRKAIELNPKFIGTYNNLGNALKKRGQLDEAITYYQKAIELNPDFFGTYFNLGDTLHNQGKLNEALLYYQKSLLRNPHHAATYHNLGSIFRDKGYPEEALQLYQEAITLNPNLAEAHANMSTLILLSGNLKKGWEEYEWRLKTKDFIAQERKFPQPAWNGSSLKGKTLLVFTEQGIGDEIMFASCLPEVIAQADLCIVECDERIVPLFARSFPHAQILERMNQNTTYQPLILSADFKIAIGSLPKFFRSEIISFPQHTSYLVPDVQRVELWRERLKILGESLKVGISWCGGKLPHIRQMRSIPLEQWDILFSIPKIHFINMQYGDCSAELKEVREKFGITIYDWEDIDPLKNLDDFAACIAALDLVISVDNATVHMAGALGVPVWTLLPFMPDWRWMLNREDSPWYPTMRLFRQSSQGDWETVIISIKNELHNLLKINAF